MMVGGEPSHFFSLNHLGKTISMPNEKDVDVEAGPDPQLNREFFAVHS
jgi:hypothetical protein